MTTESIRIVDPGNGAGTDYTSLSLWAVAEAADLVSADIIAVAQCRATGGAADTTMVPSLSGFISDSNRYVKIWTDPTEGYRHSGRWDDAAYRLSVGTTQAQTVLGAVNDIGTANLHVHIRGIQVRNSRIASYAHALTIGRGTNGALTTGTIDQCVVQTLCPGAQTRALNLSRGTAVATNCLVLAAEGAGACVGEYNGTSICRNITTWGGAYGFIGEINGIDEVTNCIAMGAATACFSGVSAGNHNISSDATAPGTTVAHNQTDYATYFVDHAGGDYHLTAPSGALFGISASDLSSTFTADLDGDTRASASFGVGADYYAAIVEIIEGVMASSVSISQALSGKIGCGGGLSSIAGGAAYASGGMEGKQGDVATGIDTIVQALSGNAGNTALLDGQLAIITQSLSGVIGISGQMSAAIADLSAIFGEQVVFQGTISANMAAVSASIIGIEGKVGKILASISVASVISGVTGNYGSLQTTLDSLSAQLAGNAGITGFADFTISTGAEMYGKLGVSAAMSSELDEIGAYLIEIIIGGKINRIVISTKTGAAVILTSTGHINITTQ